MPAWDDYQENVANFLRNQHGVTAATNVPMLIPGGASVNIDVVAKLSTLGLPVTWLIECKAWQSRVPQEKVFAFLTVVNKLGADRGLLVAESGFQSGCYNLTNGTNVYLVTLEELKANVRAALTSLRISDFTVRIALAHHRYWQHSKAMRNEYDLKLSIWSSPTHHYSASSVIEAAGKILKGATLGSFPIHYRTLGSEQLGPSSISNTAEAVEWLELNLTDLEHRLDTAEADMERQGDFQPKPRFSSHYWSKLST